MNTDLQLQEKDLELVVSEKTLGHLTTNALQIKQMVENALPQYSSSNYDSSNIDKAKKDKAALNKAAKALNTKRIEIEKEFVKPFSEFKEIVSNTVKLIGECSFKIDIIVKEEERKYKEDKRTKIVEYYNKLNVNDISFERIEKSEWLNKGVKENKIFEEIDGIVSRIDKDLKTLSQMPESEALQVYYKQCLDLSQTMQYATQLSEQKKKAEQAKREVEAQKADAQSTQIRIEEPVKVEAKADLYVRTFKVECSRDQLIALGNYMNENGIKFEKV